MSIATNEAHKRLYQERKLWGACIICGRPLRDDEETLSCSKCIQQRAEYREDNRQHIRESTRDRMNRYRAAGLCVYCGKPVVEGKKLCQYHREYYSKKREDKSMKSYPKTVFAQRLIEARKRKGLTQLELATELGVKQKSMSFWETDRGYPRVDTLIKMAKILNVSTDWLLGLEE